MNPLAQLIAGAVFSIGTREECLMGGGGSPLQYFPPPLAVQRSGPYFRMAPPPPRPSAADEQLARTTEDQIIEFCQRQPQEHFCAGLREWMDRHPRDRR